MHSVGRGTGHLNKKLQPWLGCCRLSNEAGQRTPRDKNGRVLHWQIAQAELLKLQKNGQFPDDPSKNSNLMNSLCNLPEVLVIVDINATTVGGLLL